VKEVRLLEQDGNVKIKKKIKHYDKKLLHRSI